MAGVQRHHVAAAEAALRYNPRSLSDEASASLSRAVEAIAGIEGLSLIAHGAGIEAVALEGLRTDQARVLERLAKDAGSQVLTDRGASRAVVMGPIAGLAALTARLVDRAPLR